MPPAAGRRSMRACGTMSRSLLALWARMSHEPIEVAAKRPLRQVQQQTAAAPHALRTFPGETPSTPRQRAEARRRPRLHCTGAVRPARAASRASLQLLPLIGCRILRGRPGGMQCAPRRCVRAGRWRRRRGRAARAKAAPVVGHQMVVERGGARQRAIESRKGRHCRRARSPPGRERRGGSPE
jgi:hypothetical protein